ncbi:hypothetical protein Acor_60680 [Acrocarpospora corrugata]|uniref:Uncharacterized protein n=1 Tax=Acrocarpospora corrugata TaxID=35763 RepID=A0A5M3W7R0_9ACTN|nr:hypothetical protein Acor_60680 [Acrocarpospora corrugata]
MVAQAPGDGGGAGVVREGQVEAAPAGVEHAQVGGVVELDHGGSGELERGRATGSTPEPALDGSLVRGMKVHFAVHLPVSVTSVTPAPPQPAGPPLPAAYVAMVGCPKYSDIYARSGVWIAAIWVLRPHL